MYECEVEGCEWRNPDWRYGFAEAGASWWSHMDREHRSDDAGPCCRGQLDHEPDCFAR